MNPRLTRPKLRRLCHGVLLLTALAQPASATSPTTAWDALERRAAQAGAATVREDYQRLTQGLQRALAAPVHPSLAGSFGRSLQLAALDEVLASWARSEARDLRLERSNPSQAAAASRTLVALLEQVAATFATAQRELAAHYHAASEAERQRLALPVSPVDSLAATHLAALRLVAFLAKLAREEQTLAATFALTSDPIDTCTTAAEFAAFDHDATALLGTLGSPPVATAGVLTATEELAVRELVEKLFHALVARDGATVARLFVDPALGQTLAARLDETELTHCDLTQAEFTISRDSSGPDSTLFVLVSGIQARQQRAGVDEPLRGAQRFVVRLIGPEARFLSVGGAP